MVRHGGRLVAGCAVIGLLSLGAVAPGAWAKEDVGPRGGPTPRDVVVLPLSDGHGASTELIADAPTGHLAAASDQHSLLTSELDVPEFSVAAVTWSGPAEPDEEISLRVRADGQWTPWAELEPDGADRGDIGGTEPYIVGAGDAVQVRLDTDGTLTENLRLHLIPAEPAGEEQVLTTHEELAALAAADTSSATTGATSRSAAPTADGVPQVVSRSGWGADASLMRWTPRYDDLRAAVVHHTAGHNNYTAAQSAGIVRGIYHYHAVTRDWGDIGYHFLVDKYGQVFEGRAGTLSADEGRTPEAAHARGFNRGTLGISVLGDYSSVYAPDSVLATMAEVIAWRFAGAGIDMSTPSGMISPGTAARPAGQNLARIFAHRDVGATTCPGNNIYQRIPALNEQVASLLVDEYHLKNDLSGGIADLTFHLGRSSDEVLVGDWTGEGKDSLALRRGSTFYVYDSLPPGEPRIVTYGRADDVVLVGDWDGDGRDTFAVRRGKEYHVKNSMTGGPADVIIRYGQVDDRVLVGDWNGTGTDTFAVRRGHEYYIKNSIEGGEADVVLRYGQPRDTVLVGDWDGDGADSLAVRRGDAYHVRNSLTGGPADVIMRYGRTNDRVLVGDWDGDGKDTLGVRRWRS